MNPWSEAEPGSEASERELFARRARALEPAAVPSLGEVLRAARAAAPARAARSAEDSGDPRAARGAQGRAFVAMALAAACMTAAVTKLPGAAVRGSIAAEVDASAPGRAPGPGSGSGTPLASSATCELEDEVLVSEERACFAPAPLFTVAPRSALISAPSSPLACTASESCAIPTTP